ncbi:MAG: tetratricopeptide repeat protein [Planctomycetes bacterium]|nr:tetratricopeptide repeat protein [Planctomycetota bacterium]
MNPSPLIALLLLCPPLLAQEDVVRAQEPSTAAEWNERGVSLLEQGDAISAVAALQRARELAPADAVVAVNLARAFGHLGSRHLDLGRLPEALAAFRSGTGVDRDGGHNEVLAAQVQLRQGARLAARETVDRVRTDFPENSAAARLAADLRAVAGELDEAVEILRQALALTPDDASLVRRSRQLEEEREAMRGFLTDASAHFDFRYDPRRPALVEAVPDLMADLEDAYHRVARDFGLAPADRILVLVLDRERYVADAPEWSAGLYDGRVRLSVGDYRADAVKLRATMRHEFVHAALHRLGPPLPTWFQEGMAQLVEDRPVLRARQRLNSSGAPSLAELGGDWTAWKQRQRVAGAYDYSLSLCRFLAEEYGTTAYPLLFEKLRQSGFEHAFRQTFGKLLADVDAEHRRALAAEG